LACPLNQLFVRTILVKAAILSFGLAAAAVVSWAGENNDSRVFRENDLAGWQPMHAGRFFVTNGVMHLSGGKGWLRSEGSVSNFVLELEWRGLETNYNSGIFIRAPLGDDPWATNVWQVNLKQSAIGELLCGSKKVVPRKTAHVSVGDWVQFRIEARGSQLSLEVNGQPAWIFKGFSPNSGFLGFQAEGKSFEFRNVHLIQLP